MKLTGFRSITNYTATKKLRQIENIFRLVALQERRSSEVLLVMISSIIRPVATQRALGIPPEATSKPFEGDTL